MSDSGARLKIPDWLRRLLTSPVEELTRWQRALRFSIELVRHCAGELIHDKAGQMAAALTYHTLFSILPMLVLVLVALNAFVGPEERAEFKAWVVERAVETLESDLEVAVTGETEGRRGEFDAVATRLDQVVQGLLDSLERVSFRGIGLVGILVFIYGATALLATVERSFNDVFGVTSGRPWYVRLPLYYTVITLAPILVLIGLWLQRQFIGFIQAGAWTNWLVGPAAVVAPLATTWFALYLIYVLLPTARVGKRAAVVGSLVAAVGLAAAREIFRIYIARAAVTTLYGALALLPLLLLLIWGMWLVVLFGLELAYTLNAMKGREFKRLRHKLHDCPLVDPLVLLPVSAQIASAFQRGEPCTEDELGRRTRLPPRALAKLLEALKGAGLVHALAGKQAGAWVLARPAERIRVADVLQAARDASPSRPEGEAAEPAWEMVDRVEEAGRRVAGDETLAGLCGDADPREPGEEAR